MLLSTSMFHLVNFRKMECMSMSPILYRILVLELSSLMPSAFKTAVRLIRWILFWLISVRLIIILRYWIIYTAVGYHFSIDTPFHLPTLTGLAKVYGYHSIHCHPDGTLMQALADGKQVFMRVIRNGRPAM